MDIELRISSPDYPITDTSVKPRRGLHRPAMTRVDPDAFIRELGSETAVHAGLIRAVVRAFLAAALRGQDARTPDGWRSVIQDLRYVLWTALHEGVEQARPVSLRKRWRLPVSIKPQTSPRPPVAHDSLIPIIPTLAADVEEDLAWYGLPVRLVHALVRAYVAAGMSGDEGATPEGRSRILGQIRELVWDGILDAVKKVPCPPNPPPQSPARAPRRNPPGRER